MSTGFEIHHIYNGIIFDESPFYPMIEFKIKNIQLKLESDAENIEFIFRDVNYKCAWFLIDSDNKRLLGPVMLDLELIKDNIRKIKDESDEFIDINGAEIQAVSNDDLISSDQLPKWMIKSMTDKIYEVNNAIRS